MCTLAAVLPNTGICTSLVHAAVFAVLSSVVDCAIEAAAVGVTAVSSADALARAFACPTSSSSSRHSKLRESARNPAVLGVAGGSCYALGADPGSLACSPPPPGHAPSRRLDAGTTRRKARSKLGRPAATAHPCCTLRLLP